MIILLCLLIIFSLFFLGNLSSIFIKLNTFEKPIFAIGFLTIILNYLYFNLNISVQIIYNLICLILIFSIVYAIIFGKNYLNELRILTYSTLFLLCLFQLVFYLHGEQHYVFRGNQQDSFVYLSVGLTFFNNTFQELISLQKNMDLALSNKFYLNLALPLIEHRPTVGLFISILNNFKFIDTILIGFIFKIICSLLVLLSCLSLFETFEKRKIYNYILSYSFVLSAFFFYNFEIDAYSLIMSMPFIILIIKYSIELESIVKSNSRIDLFKYVFLWSGFFIIYPNGAAMFMPPVFIIIIYHLIKNKFDLLMIKNLILSLFLFLLIIAPTYKSTILYLHEEVIAGLFHGPDFWGYYGAFIFGKDNPIRDPNIIFYIKELIVNKINVLDIFKEIINLNFQNNHNFFYLNIIPSIFGYFHLTTSNVTSNLNIIFIIILIYLNYTLIKRLALNTFNLFSNQDRFSFVIKIFYLYFVVFFLILIVGQNFWSAIKLFFTLSPIFFILLFFNFTKKIIVPIYGIPLFLVILLPFYKYSDFNSGIGKLDSFPSIIHPENKKLVKWTIDKDRLLNCKTLSYDIDDIREKIYISLVYNRVNKKNAKNICTIQRVNKNFKIK